MFTFFHRTPIITLETFVTNRTIYEATPIVPAFKTYPDWWLNIPIGVKRNFDFSKVKDAMSTTETLGIVSKNSNMRNCYGFLEFYKKGAVVENWSDLSVTVGLSGYKFFNSNGIAPDEHPSTQYGKGFKNYFHMKLINPWHFREDSGTKFMLMGATWALEDYSMVIPPGVLDFTITNVANVNMFLPKRKEEFTLGMGQPLIHLVPLSDKKLKIKNNLVTEDELQRMRDYVTVSFFGWRKKFELLRRNNKRKSLKCPFS